MDEALLHIFFGILKIKHFKKQALFHALKEKSK
jgi:hypothetical protein